MNPQCGEIVAPVAPAQSRCVTLLASTGSILPAPPRKPELNVDGDLAAALRRAENGLARLGVAGEMVPSVDWSIYAFVRKEAVISSQIDGTQATLPLPLQSP
jgi:hypothetical protein